jgi:cytochrome c
MALGTAAYAETPNLGHKVTKEELAFWDQLVTPDGHNLPQGSGTAKQGEPIFAQRCAVCHGADGVKNDYGLPPLIGGQGTLATDRPVKTIGSYWPYATTLYDYLRRAMPFDDPKSLSPDEIYSLTAYLLNQNGIIGEEEVMNAKTLPKVKMPNRDGFIDRSME